VSTEQTGFSWSDWRDFNDGINTCRTVSEYWRGPPPLRRNVRNYLIVIIFCRFQSLYKTVDDIDLFPAAMAENPADTDALLGGLSP